LLIAISFSAVHRARRNRSDQPIIAAKGESDVEQPAKVGSAKGVKPRLVAAMSRILGD
jgi:hypothetical protein